MMYRCFCVGKTINGVAVCGRRYLCCQSRFGMIRTPRVTGTPPRRGYTLAEMLIAMILVAALMSVAWGVMSMYNSLLTAGQSQTTEQQLVRSLFQIMSEDLSAVVLKAGEQSSLQSGSGVDGGLLPMEFDLEEFTAFPDVSGLETGSYDGPARITLRGSPTAIRLTIRRPPQQAFRTPSSIDLLSELGGGSQQLDTLQEGMAVKVAEFQTVVYQLQPFGQTEGISSLPSGLYRLQSDAVEFMDLRSQRSTMERSLSTDDVSIDRSTLESLLFPQNDPIRDTRDDQENSSPPSYELIPEVVGCRFQYFDRQAWVQDWPESRAETLPAAVRISLDVITATELEKLSPALTDSDSILKEELDRSFSTTDAAGVPTRPVDSDPWAGIVPRTFSRIILLDTTRSIGDTDAKSPDFAGEFLQ
ncbi:MAG TPA: prepilin-type N-terminal cleavage/methylation domain-containing protein [Planctomycetes bacterium]|nr:prepilin-type N-terminal cleavage/methylation domain-containing protein [Fuerstiella sp.]HIK96403.1 prepilin-type N-terminal cleavage/methylation domain-containing protein [Planctomycetota bacterium]